MLEKFSLLLKLWDRLDAMLVVSEEKSKRKVMVGFCGCFYAVFFGLGFFLFNSNETTEINNSTPIVTTIKEELDTVKTTKIDEISLIKRATCFSSE